MSDVIVTKPAPAEDGPVDESQGLVESISPGRLAFRRYLRHRAALVCTVIFLVIVFFVVFAPFTARFSVNESVKLPKVAFNSPRGAAWFGTDSLNRDMYSRLLWGGRISLFIGIAVALFGTLIGTIVGAYAGYRGGRIDDVLMRTTDVFLAFPFLVALLVIRNLLGSQHWITNTFGDKSSIRFMVVLLVALSWPFVARLVRGQVLSLKEKEFVESARALGASDRRILTRHILPNCFGPIMVATSNAVIAAIVAESTLSFFGFGIQPGEGKTSWGILVAEAKGAVQSGYWWLALFPCAVLVVTVLCVNFIGDGVRDAFDPKQSKARA
ncbi:MAG: ABC transporter permease [Acidimicrobiales bacterium]